MEELLQANFILLNYIEWLSNVILVKKVNGKCCMCADYTELNRVFLKYSYPLPNIDKLMDNSSRYKLLYFMDAYSKYNQILMHEKDWINTSSMRKYTNYRYNIIPFSLKSEGLTY